MDNAPDEVKAIAHHVTLDVDHSGLAAVKGFILDDTSPKGSKLRTILPHHHV